MMMLIWCFHTNQRFILGIYFEKSFCLTTPIFETSLSCLDSYLMSIVVLLSTNETEAIIAITRMRHQVDHEEYRDGQEFTREEDIPLLFNHHYFSMFSHNLHCILHEVFIRKILFTFLSTESRERERERVQRRTAIISLC